VAVKVISGRLLIKNGTKICCKKTQELVDLRIHICPGLPVTSFAATSCDRHNEMSRMVCLLSHNIATNQDGAEPDHGLWS
jgi:hypothetical protein